MFQKARIWGKSRWRSWRSIIRVLPQAGRAVPVAVLLNLVIGLLPLGFVVALMNGMADATIDFVIRDPANADRHRMAGFDAMWRMLA